MDAALECNGFLVTAVSGKVAAVASALCNFSVVHSDSVVAPAEVKRGGVLSGAVSGRVGPCTIGN